MMKIKISPELKVICPDLSLGCITAEITLANNNPDLWVEIEMLCENLKEQLTINKISNLKRVKDAREVYRKLGKDPTRYRLSSESLLRRVLQGQQLYKINNIVDINNLISLSSHFSIGSYDLDKLNGQIEFRIGKGNEQYYGIGRGQLNIENLPVLSDQTGSFGSPTSDSERTMITNGTEKVLMNIISFSGTEGLEGTIDYGVQLFQKYAGGKKINVQIVK